MSSSEPDDLAWLEQRARRRRDRGDLAVAAAAAAEPPAFPTAACLTPEEYATLDTLAGDRLEHVRACAFCEMALVDVKLGPAPGC